ncbi:hypothetical protein [Novosphingobium sp. P6W]|uniref:hypothetical protein n=1 Tax=Novosphingobium sp. P6W TaxID=1609758 RepID=UPI0013B423A9|nr:hypothetical protein [Novosphingobium sp. P6W]
MHGPRHRLHISIDAGPALHTEQLVTPDCHAPAVETRTATITASVDSRFYQ